jgi:tripartite-type tricarboxylate transporter receptor subunit TctC
MTRTDYLRRGTAVAAILVALGAAAPGSAADAIADFYKGKQMQMVIGNEAGGSYDAYARIISRHLGKHIPGNPVIVAQNMVGAASRQAANWLYNTAPKDGTALATFVQTLPVDQARNGEGIRFDVAKMNWIGSPNTDNNVTMLAASTGLQSIEDVKAKGGVICGGTGGSTPTATFPQVINNMTGTKMKIVAGYPSATAIAIALERGEVNCFGNTWGSIRSSPLITDHKLNIMVQWGIDKLPAISAYAGRDVPLITEYAKTDLDKQVFTVINAGFAIGRPIVAPPDVPADRVFALRRAFEAMLKDPEFKTDLDKAKLDLNPVSSGEHLQEIAVSVVRTSNDVLKRVDELMTAKDVEELKK